MFQLPYYYGSLSAAEADELLKDEVFGTFLIRDSSMKNNVLFNYPLTVTWVEEVGYSPRRVWHQRIEFKNNRYNLEDEVDSFPSVEELVKYYKTEIWPLSPKCIIPLNASLQQLSVNIINNSDVKLNNDNIPVHTLKQLYKI